MARVNAGPSVWRSFRVEALRREISVADYLGLLVEREMRRVSKSRTPGDNVIPPR